MTRKKKVILLIACPLLAVLLLAVLQVRYGVLDGILPGKNRAAVPEPFLRGAVVPFGETVTLAGYKGKTDIAVTYSNLRAYGSPAEAGIPEADIRGEGKGKMVFESQGKDTVFLLLDVRIENHGTNGMGGEDLQAELDAYGNNDGTAGVFWITNFAVRQQRSKPGEDAFYIEKLGYSELDYFSDPFPAEGKYYHFAMNREDVREFTVGFYASKDLFESNSLVIGPVNRSYSYGENGNGGPAYDETLSWVELCE